MQTNKNNTLISLLKRKGIIFERGDRELFKSYDYYQVINGYKNLFVDSIENIETIYENVISSTEIERYKNNFNVKRPIFKNDLFREICKKICNKYGLYYSNKLSNKRFIEEINEIGYIHHIYNSNAKYNDFVRMYKFEHELRLLLLRYTLIIEENMKNIFISVLNDFEVNANFLSDINNYNIKDVNSNNALETLKLIIDQHGNRHSKPIRRKREQNITIPYWILINELSMNQTYKAIDNLKPQYERIIFQECLNHFTNLNLNYKDKTKTYNQRREAKGKIKQFKILLNYIGEFRNMLAHNQPIYSYNIKNCDMNLFPKLYYEKPKVKRSEAIETYEKQQHLINATLMYSLQHFFGVDSYNSRNKEVNIDLSWIIYVIYKMISHIDSNTQFYKELKSIYSKYNVVLSEYKFEVSNIEELTKLAQEIDKFNNFDFDVISIINDIDNNKAYKRNLKHLKQEVNQYKESISRSVKKIEVNKIASKYNTFPFNNNYTKYTGIDASYFNKII